MNDKKRIIIDYVFFFKKKKFINFKNHNKKPKNKTIFFQKNNTIQHKYTSNYTTLLQTTP